jgi:glutaredoxin
MILRALLAAAAVLLAPGAASVDARADRFGVADTELATVTVYGAKWCGPCHILQDALRERGIPFEYVDVDADPVAWAMARKSSGSTGIPTTSIRRGPNQTWIVGANPDAVERAYRGD